MEVPAGTQCEMDPDDFGEVLGKLLDNARKFAKGRVTIRVADTGGLTMSIDDDGPGLAEGQAEGVLTRGVRGREGVEGSGPGLSIVNDVVGAYGGRLQLGPPPRAACPPASTSRDPSVAHSPAPRMAAWPNNGSPSARGPSVSGVVRMLDAACSGPDPWSAQTLHRLPEALHRTAVGPARAAAIPVA